VFVSGTFVGIVLVIILSWFRIACRSFSIACSPVIAGGGLQLFSALSFMPVSAFVRRVLFFKRFVLSIDYGSLLLLVLFIGLFMFGALRLRLGSLFDLLR